MDSQAFEGLMRRIEVSAASIVQAVREVSARLDPIQPSVASGRFEDTRYPDRDRRDHELADLVREANEDGGRYAPVRLFVGGTVLVGWLSGLEAYNDAVADDLGRTDEKHPWIAGYRSTAQVASAFWREDTGDNRKRVSFLHLVDARVLHGGQLIPSPPEPGWNWRGRLAAVDGYTVGVPLPS
jgi:hypothetical protein